MGNALGACYDDMIDFRATGGQSKGDTAGIMQRSCETVKIGGSFLFLLAYLAPRGEVGRGIQDERRERERERGVGGVAVGGSR